MRKGKKTKQPLKPRIVAPAAAPVAKPAAAKPEESSDEAVVFLAARDAVKLSEGKVAEWTSSDASVAASQDDPGAMPGFDADNGALEFAKTTFLVVSAPKALEAPEGMTIAIGFKVPDVKSKVPMVLISKGSYDTSFLYADIYDGELRVTLGDGPLARVSLAGLDNSWVDLVLFTSGGEIHVVLNGQDHQGGTLSGFVQNPDPLLIGARTQGGFPYGFLDGSIRYVRIEATDSSGAKARDLQSSLAGVAA